MEIEVVNKVITDFSYHSGDGLQQIKAESKVQIQYGIPKEKNSHDAIISLSANIQAEDSNQFQILFGETVVVRFEEEPSDYMKALEVAFKETVLDIISEDLDCGLAGIGKPPVALNKVVIV